MLQKHSNCLKWFTFDLLAQYSELIHRVFSRKSGVSSAPFDSLNLAEHVGDDPAAVASNLDLVVKQLNLKKLVCAQQVHGAHLELVSANSPALIPNCDGLITSQPNVGMMIKHADCQATIFYDPTRRLVAVIHAGWRGLVKNIYAITVERMRQLGSCPQDILVAIGPSLGPEHAEFTHYQEEFPPNFWNFQKRPNHFDLWAIARWQLLQVGIQPTHIDIASLCSFSHPEDFYSYRREAKTGRNATIVALKESETLLP